MGEGEKKTLQEISHVKIKTFVIDELKNILCHLLFTKEIQLECMVFYDIIDLSFWERQMV